MGISRLDRCPKCKGYVILDKDIYGLYEQCLQCGYIHDLQTVAGIDRQQAQENREGGASQCVTVEGSNDAPQNTPQPTECSPVQDLTAKITLPMVLDSLHEEHQDDPY